MTKLLEEITLQILINKTGDSLMDRLKKDFNKKNKSKKKKKILEKKILQKKIYKKNLNKIDSKYRTLE